MMTALFYCPFFSDSIINDVIDYTYYETFKTFIAYSEYVMDTKSYFDEYKINLSVSYNR